MRCTFSELDRHVLVQVHLMALTTTVIQRPRISGRITLISQPRVQRRFTYCTVVVVVEPFSRTNRARARRRPKSNTLRHLVAYRVRTRRHAAITALQIRAGHAGDICQRHTLTRLNTNSYSRSAPHERAPVVTPRSWSPLPQLIVACPANNSSVDSGLIGSVAVTKSFG